MDCILCEIDDVAPLEKRLVEKRLEAGDYPEDFIDMRTTATNQAEAAVFGTFHIWMSDDFELTQI
jgi:hypothetical protein